MHAHTNGQAENKALQTSALPRHPDPTPRVNLRAVPSLPSGTMFTGIQASSEPGQMNDAELWDRDLISGLFRVPL